jgi:hypothetical protein
VQHGAVNPRLLVVALLLIAGGGTALVLTSGDPPPSDISASPTPAAPSCLEPPAPRAKPAKLPDWIPEDLPLPKGTYVIDRLPTVQKLRRAVFFVPSSLDGLVRRVLEDWPKEGWVLGRGEREPGEAEDTFFRAKKFGQFRALEVYCDLDTVQMLLVFGTIPKTPAATYSPIPPNPHPSITPSPLSS